MDKFNAVRLTPAGGAGNPEASEAQVSNFLQCMHDVTKYSKTACSSSYQLAFNCMKNSLHTKDSENSCKVLLDEFAACREKWN